MVMWEAFSLNHVPSPMLGHFLKPEGFYEATDTGQGRMARFLSLMQRSGCIILEGIAGPRVLRLS